MSRKSTSTTTTEVETASLFPIECTYISANGEEKYFHMRKSLTLSEIAAISEGCCEKIVNSENEYKPYLKDFLFNQYIVMYCTDIVLPDDVDEQYSEMFDSNLINVITAYFDKNNSNSYNIARYYLDEMISHKLKEVENRSEFDLLISDIRQIVNKIDKNIKPTQIKKIVKNLSEMNFDDNNVIKAIVENLHKDKSNSDNVVPIKKV